MKKILFQNVLTFAVSYLFFCKYFKNHIFYFQNKSIYGQVKTIFILVYSFIIGFLAVMFLFVSKKINFMISFLLIFSINSKILC